MRRQIVLRLEELEKFKQVREGNAHDLERFAELLDVLTVNLCDAGQQNELGGGALYITLQRKLNETLLSRYNRWIYEYRYPETVESLSVRESACTQDACMLFGGSAVTFLTLSALSGTRVGGFWESVAL